MRGNELSTAELFEQSVSNLITTIEKAFEEKQAQNPVLIDLRDFVDYIDAMVICHGSSGLHCIAIAAELVKLLKEQGIKPLSVSGQEHGDWVVIDCNDIVVHIFQPELRDFYALEDLWAMGTIHRLNAI